MAVEMLHLIFYGTVLQNNTIGAVFVLFILLLRKMTERLSKGFVRILWILLLAELLTPPLLHGLLYNLRERRQPESKPPDMSRSLQINENERTQNWNDIISKYRMLLEEQSETIRTQKATVSEQEGIIRQQVSDIREQGSAKRSGAGQN